MAKTVPPPDGRQPATQQPPVDARPDVPLPTAQFRRHAWLAFQRALDPLAPPRPLRLPRQH